MALSTTCIRGKWQHFVFGYQKGRRPSLSVPAGQLPSNSQAAEVKIPAAERTALEAPTPEPRRRPLQQQQFATDAYFHKNGQRMAKLRRRGSPAGSAAGIAALTGDQAAALARRTVHRHALAAADGAGHRTLVFFLALVTEPARRFLGVRAGLRRIHLTVPGAAGFGARCSIALISALKISSMHFQSRSGEK